MANSGAIIAATIPEDGAAVFAAPLGTDLPTDATTELPAEWIDLGWVSEDGVTNSMKRNTTKHRAWSGAVVKVTQDSYEETLRFALLESSAAALKVAFGEDNVTDTSGALTVEHSHLMLARQSFVVEFIDGDRKGRIVIKEGQVTEVGDVKYVHKDLLMWDLTVDTFIPEGETSAVVQYFTGGSTNTGLGGQQAAPPSGDEGSSAVITGNAVKARPATDPKAS